MFWASGFRVAEGCGLEDYDYNPKPCVAPGNNIFSSGPGGLVLAFYLQVLNGELKG